MTKTVYVPVSREHTAEANQSSSEFLREALLDLNAILGHNVFNETENEARDASLSENPHVLRLTIEDVDCLQGEAA